MIGIDLAGALQKHAGDTISLLGEPFQIVGITRFKSVINRNEVVIPLSDLQEVTFRPGLLLATVFAAIGLGIFGSLYPAWRAAKQSPAVALARG